jgi:dolichol kinase
VLKKTARKVVEYSAAAFFQTMVLVVIYPSFRIPVAAFVATVSLVTCLVCVFEYFYPDSSDRHNTRRK